MPPSHVHLIDCQLLVQNAEKTVVYTRVNGITCIENIKDHKQLILPVITSPNVHVLLNNITFL